ncbi:energy transducer TonB [Mangrovibacterium lignilyticum]|uniref:energy transducer TonB n=1 Tax=Mangrovibacterium lignilyticum TaxID=2668052 RepID=UPI0013D32951|nr:energy transducer TonB [Mangrovibacterium lignilyticum]
MKTKKSPKADLERNRSTFFFVGLVLSLGLVLAAFSFKSPLEAAPEVESVNWDPPEEIIIPVTRPEEEKVEIAPLTIKDIVVDLEEGQEEINFDNYSDEANVGDLFEVNPVISNRPAETEEATVVVIAEQMPQFPGGMQSLIKFIASAVKYPALAQETGVQGKVFVRFVVNTDGSITDAMVVRSLDASLDREALRVVNNMPRWKPGMQNGKPVRVMYTVPINFVLQ